MKTMIISIDRLKSSRFSAATLLFMVFVAGSSLARADLLTNGDFEIVGPRGPNTIDNGISSQGWSAASNWGVFHNANGSTETNLGTYDDFDLPPIFGSQDPSTDHVLRLEVSHGGNGIVQTWGPLGSGPPHGSGSVWVFVRGPGLVGAGIGNGGNTVYTSFNQTINQWEKLTFTDSTSPINEFLIYNASGTSGVEFYVDFARASGVPEPATAGFGLLGLLALAGYRRRR